MPAPRILIVKTSSFGDILHALPLANRLRAGFPDARIDWLVRGSLASLVEGHPALDNVLRLEGKTLREGLRVGRVLRERGYDIAIDAQGLLYSGWLARLSGAPRRIGFDWNREGNRWFLTEPVVPARDRAPMSAKVLRLAEPLGAPPTTLESERWLALKERAFAEAALPDSNRPYVALVVGASTPVKTFSNRRWIDLASALDAQGFRPVLVGGPAEVETARAIARQVESIDMVGATSFIQLAAVLDRCDVVVGGDTGALHLAAAIGVPVVGLYGPTDPGRSGPDWGAGHALVLDAAPSDRPKSFRRAAPGLVDRIAESDVLEAIARLRAAGRVVP